MTYDTVDKFNTIDEFTQHNLMTKENTCCFTGHRAQKLAWGSNEADPRCVKMKENLKKEIVEAIRNGYVNFLCGLALGFDIICAEMVLSLKKEFPHIKLIGAIPCRTQASHWNHANRQRYENVVAKLDAARCIYDGYIGSQCMTERNFYMVDNSSLVIALYNGSSGGTKTTINYALSHGATIVALDPDQE